MAATMAPSVRPTAALALVELRLIFRRPGLAAITVLLPLVLVAMNYIGEPPADARRWGATMALHVIIAMLIMTYMNTATVLASRRDNLVFKRLRTTELGPVGVVGSTVFPIALLGTAQIVVLIAVNMATGAPAPQRPDLILAAVALGVPLSVALGALMATLTTTAERVQFTVTPLLVGVALGSQIVTGVFSDNVQAAALAFPLVAVADLVNKGWAGSDAGATALPGGIDPVLAGVGLLVVWLLLSVLLTKRSWRWEPRS